MGIEKFILVLFVCVAALVNLYYSNAMAVDPLISAIDISSSALKAHSERIKVVSQNIANEDSTGNTPGSDPYRRKIIVFKHKKDPKSGHNAIVVDKIAVDKKSQFKKKYDPSHPAANEDGYVLYPNVNKNIEFIDAKEAQRSFDANLNAIEISNSMMNKTLEILR